MNTTAAGSAITSGIPLVNPDFAIKGMGMLVLILGTRGVLAPDEGVKDWTRKEVNPTNIKIVSQMSLVCVNVGIHVFCLFFMSYELNVSVAINSLLWDVFFLKSLLNNEAETVGPYKTAEMFYLCLESLLAYGALYESAWFLYALKSISVFGIAGAIPCVVSPEFGCKLWGVVGMDKLTPAFGHGLGYNLITINAFNAALAWGVDPQIAFGYIIALFWGVLGNMKTLITPEFKEVEINKKTVMFWSTMWSVTAAVVLA
jgi:hypothetical protein